MLHKAGCMLLLVIMALSAMPSVPALAQGTTYYVSNEGDDENDGLTPATAFATIAKVNSLDLQPGDSVRLTCGDIWRAEMLMVTESGSEGNPITFGSYPADCTDKPILSGAQPIGGWAAYAGNIYVADLAAGSNADKFPLGVNQLFRDGERLRLGRWPNLDDPAADNGYATIDEQPAGDRITDYQLPGGDWTGAVAHIKGMRWYILNREVVGTSGTTLFLNAGADCWDGSCAGWGYFLNNHLGALDQDGEWYHDAATNRVYLYSTGGSPANVEGSVVMVDDDRSWGGIVLGEDLGDHITDVVIENLDVRHWFRHGIATPTNLYAYENSRLTIRDCSVNDVDGIGVNLATWVYDAQDGQDGWRGGNQIEIIDTVIDGPNHRGIDTYAKNSIIQGNVIRNVALAENLGKSGMGCHTTAPGGYCTEDGDGIRIKVGEVADSGNNNLIQYNRLERIGYNGMDLFGPYNTMAYNVIDQACYSKGDCGGVRTFGNSNLGATNVHDLVFDHNIILEPIGNTDGCAEAFKSLFGFGLYIDNYSRDVEITGNTILSSTVAGILYQNSTGTIRDNVLYNNSAGSIYSAQVSLGGSPAFVAEHSGNVLYGLTGIARTLSAGDVGRVTASDDNYFFQPYVERHIAVEGNRTLAEWQAFSGQDAHSTEHWFTLGPGDPPLSRAFYNDTAEPLTVDLTPYKYLDLDQNEVIGSITLQPFTSQVLIFSGEFTEPDLSLSTKAASPPSVASGERITYTITLRSAGGPLTHTVAVTDVVPAGLTYLSGTLTASTGSWTDAGAPSLRWTGALTPAPTAFITYVVTADYVFSGTTPVSTPRSFENTAEIVVSGYDRLFRSATVHVDWLRFYMPVILKAY